MITPQYDIDIDEVPDAFWQDLVCVERGAGVAAQTLNKEITAPRRRHTASLPKAFCALPPGTKVREAPDEDDGDGGGGGVVGGGGGWGGGGGNSDGGGSGEAPVIPHKKRRLPPSLAGGGGATSDNVRPPRVKHSAVLPVLTFPGEVVVAETPEEIDATVQRLIRLCGIPGHPRHLGWDIEWVVTFERGPPRRTSLMQFCVRPKPPARPLCALLRLCRVSGGITPAFRSLLEDNTIQKVGVQARGDAHKIMRDFKVPVAAVVELKGYAADRRRRTKGPDCLLPRRPGGVDDAMQAAQEDLGAHQRLGGAHVERRSMQVRCLGRVGLAVAVRMPLRAGPNRRSGATP